MYTTYQSKENGDENKMNLNYEERLIPKEIGENKKEPDKKQAEPVSHSRSFADDDFLLILLLVLLMKEDGDDNLFIIILIALIFIK